MKDGKTKATSRNQRSKKDGSVLNANHNTLEATRTQQGHIDQERFSQNSYIRFESDGRITNIKGGTGGFNATEHEKKRFKELYQDGLDARNERYIKNRNKSRCRTMEDLYRDPKTAPLESLWQVGNSKSNLSTNEMRLALTKAWSATCTQIQRNWGDNVKMLDAALHMDETVPHIHSRMTLGAFDKDGHFMPNQEQAFKQMGIERPDTTKPISRYNNALIAFSDTVREMFYQNCERQGIQIDREVTSPSKRRKDLLELQCERAAAELEESKREAEEVKTQAEQEKRAAQEAKETRKREEKKLEKLGAESQYLSQAIEEQKQEFMELEKQVESKKIEVKETIKSLTSITDEIREARKNPVKDPEIIGTGTKRKDGKKVPTVELYEEVYQEWKQQKQLVPRLDWVADSIDRVAARIEKTFQVDELVQPWKDRADRAERAERSIQIAKAKDEIEIDNLKWFLRSIGRMEEYERIIAQTQEQEQTHNHRRR